MIVNPSPSPSPSSSPSPPSPDAVTGSMDHSNVQLKIVYKKLSWTVDIPNPDEATKKAKPTVPKQVLHEISGVFKPVTTQRNVAHMSQTNRITLSHYL